MLRSDSGSSGLSERVVTSGLWLAGLAGTGRLIGLVRLVALAHLLGPRDFGLVGAALVTIGMLEALSELGLFLALVQRKHAPSELLDTAWTIGLIRGALIATATFWAAPWIAVAFASREAMEVVRAMALVPLVGSLANVGMVEFRRELAFGRYYLIQSGAIVVDLLVAVPLALWLRSAWAIVGGWLALSATRVMLSYALHPYRPRLRLHRQHASGLLSYGRWITGSAALQWAIGEGVAAIVGRFYGLEGLALYQVAWRVTGQPASEAATLVSTVTVSAYARLQPTPMSTRLAYFRVLRVAMLGALPLALCLALYADEIVALLFGAPWQQSAGLVRILAAFAVVSVVSVVTAPVFQGIGRPKDQALVSIAEALTLAVALPFGLAGLGLAGAAVATLARGIVGACLSLWLVMHRLAIDWRPLLSILAWPTAACAPILLLRLGPSVHASGPAGLVAALSASFLLYMAGLFLLHRFRLHELDPVLVEATRQAFQALFCRRRVAGGGPELVSRDVAKRS